MTRWLILALCLLTRSAAAAGADEAWAGYRFAPDALAEIDLASDTAWTLSLDGSPARPIRVTAGGWNSDFQSPPIVSDTVRNYAVTVIVPFRIAWVPREDSCVPMAKAPSPPCPGKLASDAVPL